MKTLLMVLQVQGHVRMPGGRAARTRPVKIRTGRCVRGCDLPGRFSQPSRETIEKTKGGSATPPNQALFLAPLRVDPSPPPSIVLNSSKEAGSEQENIRGDQARLCFDSRSGIAGQAVDQLTRRRCLMCGITRGVSHVIEGYRATEGSETLIRSEVAAALFLLTSWQSEMLYREIGSLTD